MPVKHGRMDICLRSYQLSRWLSVHISDLVQLAHKHPDLHQHFQEGHFVLNKTCSACSAIAFDQEHEQNNGIVKGDGGAIDILQNPAALLKEVDVFSCSLRVQRL